MAFSYDVSTPLGQLRLEIGDTILDAGPRPGGLNYSDAELNVVLSPVITAGNGYNLAVSRVLRRLANEWSKQANISIGEYSAQYASVAENYRKQAAAWETTIDTTGAGVSGGITVGTMTLAGRVLTIGTSGAVT